ncbi:MAG TPA: toll/interleukin-1 receptor domain-containing protein [Ilumatobacteraceae bacterium]|nr:toll/interleukin-1 receptor domain-containing protein [Ilumatobacteraceae bacterium]
MGDQSVLVIAADDDRQLILPLVDALAGIGAVGFDPPSLAEVALLVASRRAAVSADVDRLLAAWTDDHPAESVLIVLVDGELHWDIDANSFDAVASNALSHDAQSRFVTRPLWLDARGGMTAHLVTRMLAALTPDGTADASPPKRLEAPSPAPSAALPDDAMPRREPSSPKAMARWPLIVAVSASLAAVAVLIALRLSPDDRVPGEDLPSSDPSESSSGTSPWVFLVTGLALGLMLGLMIRWRRRNRPPRAASTSPRRHPVTMTSTSTAPPPPPAPSVRGTVFISHSFETDHQLALRLAADLRADADVWVAPESIAPGESWLSSVERGLGASRVFLALLSKASLASPWVLKEIQAAMELEIRSKLRLVPVEVEDCEVPILLRTYQTLRLAMGYRELVEQTRRLVNAPS